MNNAEDQNYNAAAAKIGSVHGCRQPSAYVVWQQHIENGLQSFDDAYLQHRQLKENVH